MHHDHIHSGIVLFLDFDGVLHSSDLDTAAPHIPLDPLPPDMFAKAHDLEMALAYCQTDVHLVISSSWRRLHTLPALKAFIPSLAWRVVGVTPMLPVNVIATRYQEIRQWVARRQVKHWLAIDDSDAGWPLEDRHRLIHCDGKRGLTRYDLALLVDRLDELWDPPA